MATELTDQDVVDRLRRALPAVAATLEVPARLDAAAHPPAAVARRRSRRSRRGAAALAATAALVAAGAHVSTNPEVVTSLPVDVLQRGTVDGDTYYLVPSRHADVCGRRWPGVEVLLASQNRVNQDERHTVGMSYREHDPVGGCARPATPADLHDPAAVSIGFSNADDDGNGTWIAAIGVHPDIRTLVVTAHGRAPQRVPTVAVPSDPRGPRYAVVTVPAGDPTYVLELRDAAGRQVARRTESTPHR